VTFSTVPVPAAWANRPRPSRSWASRLAVADAVSWAVSWAFTDASDRSTCPLIDAASCALIVPPPASPSSGAAWPSTRTGAIFAASSPDTPASSIAWVISPIAAARSSGVIRGSSRSRG